MHFVIVENQKKMVIGVLIEILEGILVNMTKYNEETRKIRKLAREFIPKLLEKEPLAAKIIVEKTRVKFPKNCDNSIKCECGGKNQKNSGRPEWKHQVLWAIQDCKYHNKITFDSKTKKYSFL